MNLLAVQSKSVGECLASSVGSAGQFVVDVNRALLCCRFAQLPEGVGRSCEICQHFSNPERDVACGRRPRVRGGVFHHRQGWY